MGISLHECQKWKKEQDLAYGAHDGRGESGENDSEDSLVYMVTDVTSCGGPSFPGDPH